MVGALWLVHPYFQPRLLGAGDALWYHHLLADAVTQFRAGVFPVFVGQSDFSFNGAVYPLRAAPYYQYLAGLLDLMTGRTLGFFALQHLTVILSFVAGAFSAYAALLWLAPAHRWTAALLALLYVMCPGVAGLLYAQDLYMSCMTIPWVPLAFAAMIRWFDDETSPAPPVVLAASLAALWWAHSPIALWATLTAAATQFIRLLFARPLRASFNPVAVAAAVFTALAAYPIISVFLLRTPGETIVPYLMDRESLLREVRQVFPASVLPLNPAASTLTHLQLGYGLGLALLASVVAFAFFPRARPRPRALGLLLLAAAFFLVLVFPVPFATRALWFSFPETLVGMTLYWPMQRLYIIIAAISIVCAQRLLRDATLPNSAVRTTLLASLALAALWSAAEASKLLKKTRAQADTVSDSRRWALTENLAIQRHTYGLFSGRPAYFSHGVVDPRLESRLLSPDTLRILGSNYDLPPSPAFAAAPAAWRDFSGVIDANPGILNLRPALTLRAGERTLLTFHFARPDTTGVLQLIGPNFYREYVLPLSGEALAFGSAPRAEKSIALWTTTPGTETIELRFIPTAPGATASAAMPFARYRVTPVDAQKLPVNVSALIPYRAAVTAPAPAFLETPRMFVPGYTATVNRAAVPVRKSPAALVMFPVPAGESRVELRFTGPLALRLAFWLSFAAWLTVTGLGVRLLIRQFRAAPAR